MSEAAPTKALKVLVYSDDRTVRDQVRLALGRKIAADLGEHEVFDCATAPAVIKAVEATHYDLLILDAEAVPLGGMGVAHQLKDEIADCPPVLLLVARAADAWLATWSKAEAIVAHPVDPVRLPEAAAELLRRTKAASA